MRLLRILVLSTVAVTIGSCTAIKNYLQCPSEMVYVSDDPRGIHICMDRFEYTHRTSTDLENSYPVGYRNHSDCQQLCESQEKRLPSNDEWVLACEGTDPNQCNRSRPHPLLTLAQSKDWIYNGTDCSTAKNMWSVPCMNDPRINQMKNGLAANGEFKDCVSKFGIYNMVGNLGEWVSDTHYRNGIRLGRFNGGLYPQAKSTCSYTTIAHGPNYKDYSIGCRCAKKPYFG